MTFERAFQLYTVLDVSGQDWVCVFFRETFFIRNMLNEDILSIQFEYDLSSFSV